MHTSYLSIGADFNHKNCVRRKTKDCLFPIDRLNKKGREKWFIPKASSPNPETFLASYMPKPPTKFL